MATLGHPAWRLRKKDSGAGLGGLREENLKFPNLLAVGHRQAAKAFAGAAIGELIEGVLQPVESAL
ncbi:hypothetical protein ASE63_20450 [Bosea sp. Root381]|nr:hypothetical protein ASE63_20450 [Bosea sp. Root381]